MSSHDDEVWKGIVESYGDRPTFPEPARDPEPVAETPVFEVPVELGAATWEDEGHYVPPEPPPAPRPQGLRGAAWIGLFGVPALALLLTVLHVSLPGILVVAMLAAFVGGFGYLVATMKGPDDPDSGWDDGAVL
ncbi:MAG: hypothetical protein ACJ72D_04605 [Marmoricola sp.]